MMEGWDPRSWLHYVNNSADFHQDVKLSVWSDEWRDGDGRMVDHIIIHYWFVDDVCLVTNLSVTDFIGARERDNDTRQDYKFTRLNLFCVGSKQTEGKNIFMIIKRN